MGLVLEAGAVIYGVSRGVLGEASTVLTLAIVGLALGLIGVFLGLRDLRLLFQVEECMELFSKGDVVGADSYITKGRGILPGVRKVMTPAIDAFFKLVGGVQRGSEELSYVIDLLERGIETHRKGLGEISQAMNEIASAADEEAGVAQRVANGVEAIGSLAQGIADTASNLKALAQEANELTSEAYGKMNALLEDIRRVASSNEDIAQKVLRLSEEMEQINRFVDTLTEIAEQTNLLALNAAIEAARAGESGRGFAVVAEEIRKLAMRSNSSAREISNLAKSIRERAKEAATDVVNGASLVRENVGKGEEVVLAIKRFSDAFAEVNGAVSSIADRVREQVNEIGEISQEAERLASVSQETAASVEEVTASVTEQNTATEQMEGYVKKLVETATRLRNIAGQYTKETWSREAKEKMANESLKVLQRLADMPEFKSLDLRRIVPIFDKAFEGHPYIKTPLLVGLDGKIIHADSKLDRNIDWSFRPWFQGALKGEPFVGDPYVSLGTNRPAFAISCPVKNDRGEVIAILAANVDDRT